MGLLTPGFRNCLRVYGEVVTLKDLEKKLKLWLVKAIQTRKMITHDVVVPRSPAHRHDDEPVDELVRLRGE